MILLCNIVIIIQWLPKNMVWSGASTPLSLGLCPESSVRWFSNVNIFKWGFPYMGVSQKWIKMDGLEWKLPFKFMITQVVPPFQETSIYLNGHGEGGYFSTSKLGASRYVHHFDQRSRLCRFLAGFLVWQPSDFRRVCFPWHPGPDSFCWKLMRW